MNIQKPAFGLILLASAAFAEVPRTMLFQGSVAQKGTPVTGSHKVVIDICTSNVVGAKDCTTLFPSTDVAFSKGYYSVLLGENTPLPVFDKQYYLEVSIDGTVSESRIALTSTPSALNAIRADSAAVATVANSVASNVAVTSINGMKNNVTIAAGTGMTASTNGSTVTLSSTLQNITSQKDSTFFTDGVLFFDDTVSLVSQSSKTLPYGSSFLQMINKTDTTWLKISSGTTTNSSAYNSVLILSEDKATLASSGGSAGGGGSGASIEIQRGGHIAVNADTVDFSREYGVIHVPVLKLKAAYTNGQFGTMPGCTEKLLGTIIYDPGYQGSNTNFRGCVYNGPGSTPPYSWAVLNN